jgi:hypothetical protein
MVAYLDERDSQMVALMEDLFLEACEVVHDEGLLSGVNQEDAVGSSDETDTAECQQLTELVRHSIIFNSG